jgi:hypothetical protein
MLKSGETLMLPKKHRVHSCQKPQKGRKKDWETRRHESLEDIKLGRWKTGRHKDLEVCLPW